MDNDLQLNVAQLIFAVRAELERAELQRRNQGSLPLLQLSELELELHFVVTRKLSGSGEVDLKVLTLGGEKGVEREQVQKVRLKFALAQHALNTSVPGSRFSGETARDVEKADVAPME